MRTVQTALRDIRLNASIKLIEELLISALEGGSNYWCRIVGYKEPKEVTFRTSKDMIFRHIDYPLSEGGAVILDVPNEPDYEGKTFSLDKPLLAKGLAVMKKKYLSAYNLAASGNGDADTGDIFLQCCLFGETVFC